MGTGQGRAQAGVKFTGVGLAGQFADVDGVRSRSGKNNDAVSGQLNEFTKCGAAFGRCGSPARTENAGRAGQNDVFERFLEIGTFIKGPVRAISTWLSAVKIPRTTPSIRNSLATSISRFIDRNSSAV